MSFHLSENLELTFIYDSYDILEGENEFKRGAILC